MSFWKNIKNEINPSLRDKTLHSAKKFTAKNFSPRNIIIKIINKRGRACGRQRDRAQKFAEGGLKILKN